MARVTNARQLRVLFEGCSSVSARLQRVLILANFKQDLSFQILMARVTNARQLRGSCLLLLLPLIFLENTLI